MEFRKWLQTEGASPASKTVLYPLGYGGIGLYPPIYSVASNADALYYIVHDTRLNVNYDNGEGPPNSIKHIKGSTVPHSTPNTVLSKPDAPNGPLSKELERLHFKNGERSPWNISHL